MNIRHLLFIFLIPLLCSCVSDDEPKGRSLRVGDPLPIFSVTLSDGSVIFKSSLEGKAAVIEFFNTGCPDCRKALPELQKIHEAFISNPDVAVIAISREEDAQSVEKYWKANGFTIPYSAQDDASVFHLFASSGIPHMFISDRRGIITAIYTDTDMPTPASIVRDIQAALSSSAR